MSSSPAAKQYLAAAGLVVMPWRLGDVARGSSVRAATTIGAAAVSLALGMLGSSQSTAGAELFAGMGEYAWAVARMALLLAAIALIPVASMGAGYARDRMNGPRALGVRRRAELCAVLLAPACVLAPLLAWGGVIAVMQARHRGFGAGTGMPQWIDWGVFDAAVWALPVMALAGVVVGVRVAFARLSALPEHGPAEVCIKCGYPLRGLPLGLACPEWGGGRRGED